MGFSVLEQKRSLAGSIRCFRSKKKQLCMCVTFLVVKQRKKSPSFSLNAEKFWNDFRWKIKRASNCPRKIKKTLSCAHAQNKNWVSRSKVVFAMCLAIHTKHRIRGGDSGYCCFCKRKKKSWAAASLSANLFFGVFAANLCKFVGKFVFSGFCGIFVLRHICPAASLS